MSPDPELPCPYALVRFSRSSSPRSSSRPLPSPSNPPFPTKPFVKPISSASVTTVRSHTSSTNVPSASRRRSPGPTSRRSPSSRPSLSSFASRSLTPETTVRNKPNWTIALRKRSSRFPSKFFSLRPTARSSSYPPVRRSGSPQGYRLRSYDFWKDVQARVFEGDQERIPERHRGEPNYFCGEGGCTPIGATLHLEFPATLFTSDTVTVRVFPPDGPEVSVDFDITTLR